MKAIIISDDVWYLSGISEGMKAQEIVTECWLIKNSDDWKQAIAGLDPYQPKERLVLLCVSNATLLSALTRHFYGKTKLCISPPGLNSSRPFFCQNGVYYFNKNIALAELIDIFMLVLKTKNRKENTLTEREMFILNELISAGSVKGVYNAVRVSYRVVSYYKRSALKKMGLPGCQNYLTIYPAIVAVKKVLHSWQHEEQESIVTRHTYRLNSTLEPFDAKPSAISA
ncbi:hypothetical protein [Pseudocitrobacter cyperus]|uniref:HTH luxR-type domain-containing protein n=1 Tax=Pseudocitrobacter cyperus TaxID=3112843 RepID=A0ABV0HHE1_9ENTR